ncbi:MAG: hypothetical protein ACK4ZS_08520 [Sulfurimicrobium sp.]
MRLARLGVPRLASLTAQEARAEDRGKYEQAAEYLLQLQEHRP